MDKIGELIKPLNPQPSTAAIQKTPAPSPQVSEWGKILLVMAQDKRHDLAPEVVRYWRAKLAPYQEAEIVEALMLGSHWEFFPSVDQVIELIERKRTSAYQERGNLAWEKWKAEQKQAEAEGKLATEEQYEELRQAFKRVAGKVVTAEQLEAHRKGFQDVMGMGESAIQGAANEQTSRESDGQRHETAATSLARVGNKGAQNSGAGQ